MLADAMDCTGSQMDGREERRIALLQRRAVAMLMYGGMGHVDKCLSGDCRGKPGSRRKMGGFY